MAENQGIGESGTAVRGNEWEVVSLTASTYAAAPGPKATEQDIEEESNVSEGHEGESSRALFMSRHFAFPVDESLQSEADKNQTHNTDKECELVGEGYKADNQFISTPELKTSKNRLGPNPMEEEDNLSNVAPNSSVPAGALFDQKVGTLNFTKLPEPGSDVSNDVSKVYAKDDSSPGGSDLPREAWWKRQAAVLFAHVKESNTLWTIFITAAVMGLVCLGHHWRKERRQILQVKWHVSVKEEKPGRVLQPISLLKNVIAGGSRANPFTHGPHYEL